jgi:ABC-type multidrug transport system permease subunit
MAKVKKINVLSLVRFQAIMGAIIGLILGIAYSFGGLIIDALVSAGLITSSETPGLSYGTVLAFGALIGMPIIFSIFGFIVGLLEAFLFNLFARWMEGIELDFEK